MDQHNDGRDTHRLAEAALSKIAARQHSVFARFQAIDVGFTRGMIDRRVSSRRWLVEDYRVYRIAGAPPSWEQRLMAACLAGPAVASHRAAGLLWDFPGMPKDIVEVTALRHRRRHAADVTWHESYHLTERDVTEVAGVPVTKPVRTFLDLGSVLSPASLEEVLDDGLRRNLISIPTVWKWLQQLGVLRVGAKRVQTLLESRAGERPTDSVLETRFRQLVRDADLPAPVKQVEIRTGNEIQARIDFAYPDQRIAIELDGAAFHSGRQAELRDRSRENGLAALGWRVLRFTWDDIHDRRDWVVHVLKTALLIPT